MIYSVTGTVLQHASSGRDSLRRSGTPCIAKPCGHCQYYPRLPSVGLGGTGGSSKEAEGSMVVGCQIRNLEAKDILLKAIKLPQWRQSPTSLQR